eukprot:SM000004S14959  [mRNA]  locus=s4:464862:466729:- [translate_table: standard]
MYVPEQLIRHRASQEHQDAVNAWFREHGADKDQRQLHIITAHDLAKWEKACKKVSKADEHAAAAPTAATCTSNARLGSDTNHIQSRIALECLMPAVAVPANGFPMHALLPLPPSSLVPPLVGPSLPSTPLFRGVAGKTLPGGSSSSVSSTPRLTEANPGCLDSQDTRAAAQVLVPAPLLRVAAPAAASSIAEGNVHTGALPPWLQAENGLPDSSTHNGTQAGNLKVSLSRSQKRKLAKLRNPKRVGAAWAEQRLKELARETSSEGLSATPASEKLEEWLPSFGRVWQSGSRLDTRKEFIKESQRQAKTSMQANKARVGFPVVKPYVSKRQRLDLNDGKETSCNE